MENLREEEKYSQLMILTQFGTETDMIDWIKKTKSINNH